MADTMEDRIRRMQAERINAAMSQNSQMTTWEPTGEVVPISEYNARQQSAGRPTKEDRIGGDTNELVDSPVGRVPWWMQYERRQGNLASPKPLSEALPAPGRALAEKQAAALKAGKLPMPVAPAGVKWEDLKNYTVWEPTGEVIPIAEYNARQAAAGRSTKEAWVAPVGEHDPVDTPFGQVPAWLRYERSAGWHATPMRLSNILHAPGAAAAKAQLDAAAGKPQAAAAVREPQVAAAQAGDAANAGRPRAVMMDAPEDDMEADPGVQKLRDEANWREVRAREVQRKLAGADRPQGGILPGEEQVTTADTLRGLPPAVQQAVRAKYAESGHAGKIPFEDWLGDSFGEMPPKERAAAITQLAGLPAQTEAPINHVAANDIVAPRSERERAAWARQTASDIAKRHARMMTPDVKRIIDAAVANGDTQTLREINAQLGLQTERDSWRDVKNRQQNYHISQDLRNPNYAPGMGVRSLVQAIQSGNSELAGAMYDIYGNPTAGAQSRALAGAKAQAAAEAQAAQIDAYNQMQMAQLRNGGGKGDEDDPLKMQRLSDEMNVALAESDPVRRHQSVRTVIAMNPAFQNAPADQIEAETQRTIASHMAQSGTPQGRDFAIKYLDGLKADKSAFMNFAMYSLGMAQPAAEAMYADATRARDWHQWGLDWGRAIGSAIPNAGQAGKAALSGIGQGFRGK